MKSKLMKRLTYSFGVLLFSMLMVVNIQVATSTENNIGDLNLMGLEASIFTPAAVATFHTCFDYYESCTFNCGKPIDCLTCTRVNGDNLDFRANCNR